MANKTLAIFGIVGYILTVITSAMDAEGNFLAPIWLIIVAGIVYLLFHILALKRIWKAKFESRLLLFSFIILIIFEISKGFTSFVEGGSIIILLNNITIIVHLIAYFWAVAFLWKLGKETKEAEKKLKRMGWNFEDIALIKKEANKGRDAVLQKIIDLQEKKEQEIKEAAGINLKDIIPEIGKELIIPGAGKVFISWADIANHIFRVLEFERVKPFGCLLVESPIFNNCVRLPIIHSDDFQLASKVFDDRNLNRQLFKEKSLELLVVYAPKHRSKKELSLSPYHVLHYLITSHGTLDAYYSMDNDMHMRWPNPQKLFGPFVYKGEPQVSIKPKIKL